MPRARKIDRPCRIEAQVPESIASKVKLELFSELEGRVPTGAMSELITNQLKSWLEGRGVQV